MEHPPTDILISAFDVNGALDRIGYSPEGSSIWMACHMLQVVDLEYANEQYNLACKELKRSFLFISNFNCSHSLFSISVCEYLFLSI